jgi:hypothetical protein
MSTPASLDHPGPISAADRTVLVSLEMGYGHLRAAAPLASALRVPLLHADRTPLAEGAEALQWNRLRRAYERVSRASQYPLLGRPARWLLEGITDIPYLYPYRDQSAPTLGVRLVEAGARRGLGEGLVRRLRRGGAGLVTTFYVPALVADYAGLDRLVCVVTDSDLNRVWVAHHPAASRIHYCVPSERALRRLRAYGVARERIHLTGFPLPAALLGGSDLAVLKRNLAARLVRLDPGRAFRRAYRDEISHFLGPLPVEEEGRPPLLAFAVGGAGAQAGLARRFLPSLAPGLRDGTLRLALVAGTRAGLAARFHDWAERAGLGSELASGAVRVVQEATVEGYLQRFEALLAETDVLWTKPSELSFYGALGLPLVFSWPVGVHERQNRRWVLQRGAGLKQEWPDHAGLWLGEWLAEGTLAAAAWSGYMRLPKFGTTRVAELVAALWAGE